MHVFYAQGGGLGHLTRIDAFIATYNIPCNEVVIISPSHFSNYFKQYAFVKLSWNATPHSWTETINNYLKTHTITAFYVDTFPFGLKGELCAIYETYSQLNTIYISRILKWEFYLKTIGTVIVPNFSKTILLEPLYDSHFNWIKKQSEVIEHLELTRPKYPEPITTIDKPYILVVHSGGKEDVEKICNLVVAKEALNSNIEVKVFTQVDFEFDHPSFKIYRNIYPVRQYFANALKIYTAAGFNLIQELKPFKYKHIILPLNKLFDDQVFRFESLNQTLTSNTGLISKRTN